MKPEISAEAGKTLDDLMPRSTVVLASFSFLCDYSCNQYEFIIQKLITGVCSYRHFKDKEGHNELSVWYPKKEIKAPGLVAATPYLAIAEELLERTNPRLLVIDPVFTGSMGYEGRYEGELLPDKLKERETISAGFHFAETAYNNGVPVVVYAQEKAWDEWGEDWLTLFCTQVLNRKRFIPDNEDPENTVQAILALLNP